ncbi:hypothetical protein [Mesorhizobium sp. BE184]|uniref:hypothetical protein n=1 Tax=Mesorhizobium sp. BE184 TaxID=2817714 RepID=UPI0028625479|nr:hypothetical protein [Mesorhizobium sp. BE184]MDR7031646.1 putative integral membrane protein [Mesorhizobium sp. BE184]
MPRPAPTSEIDQDENEITLASLFKAIWGIRVWIVAGILLALLLAVVAVLALRVGDYQTRSQYVIQFRFEGRAENRYPNGVPFSLGDIVAPAVLTQVFERQKLAEQGLSLRDFQSAVSISPYVPTRAFIIASYSQALNARGATVAELREAQDALTRDLDIASQRYAVITFSQEGFALPADKVSAILTDIAKTWESTAIETRGVLKQDIRTIDPKIFDPANVQGLERLSTLDFVSKNLVALRGYLNQLARLPGGNLAQDKTTGQNIESLARMVDRSATQLTQLPADWADSTSEAKSQALGLPINLYSETLFDPKQVDNMEYLVAIDLLRDRAKLIRDNIQQIVAAPSGNLAVDPETGLAARDVDRLLFDTTEGDLKQLTAPILSLGIAKNPDFVRIYYNSRLQELRRSKETLENKARVLQNAGQSYQGMGRNGPPSAQGGGAEFPGGNSTVIPQFGDAFLDRIIALSQQGGDAKFRQELLKQMVDLQQESADLDEEIGRIVEYINVFSKSDASPAPEEAGQYQTFVKKIDTDIPGIMAKLKNYAAVTERIALRLRLAQDIHSVAVGDFPGGSTNVGVDFYLRDVGSANTVTMPVLLSQLKSYTESANRIYADLSSTTLGTYMNLFRAAAEPQQIAGAWITRFEILLLLLAAAAGALLGGVAGLIHMFTRRRAAAAL